MSSFTFIATVGPITAKHIALLEPAMKSWDDENLSSHPRHAGRQFLSGLIGAGFDVDPFWDLRHGAAKIGDTIEIDASSIHEPHLHAECERKIRRGAERMGLPIKIVMRNDMYPMSQDEPAHYLAA